MLRPLDELFWVLRREGFVISTAQAIDATRAVELVGFSDPRMLVGALAAVLVQRRSDGAGFERIVERFFRVGDAHTGDLFGRLGDQGFTPAELDALRQLLDAWAAAGHGGDVGALRSLTDRATDLDALLLAAGVARTLAPMTSALQAGFFTQELAKRLGVSRAASAVRRLGDALREALGDERGRALASAVAAELERVRRRLREHVERTLERRGGSSTTARPSRLDVPFVGLGDADVEPVRRAVRTLAERLRGAERVRRRHAERGRIDPHKTLRKSLETGGIPFAPVRKRRRRDKTKLVVACDVSDSVRTASTFMLEFVRAAHELFAGTRSFVFVSELGEVTELLAEGRPGDATRAIAAGDVVSLAHNSHYGRALAQLEARVIGTLDRRTTVVILGDGRTNYLDAGIDVVERLKERAAAVVWLCPESPSSWGTGDSAMTRFATASSKVLVARTARELEDAARELTARRR